MGVSYFCLLDFTGEVQGRTQVETSLRRIGPKPPYEFL